MVVLLWLGCSSEAADKAGDSEADSGDSAQTETPAADCEPATVEEVQVWYDFELPADADRSHTTTGVGLGDLDGDGWLDVLMAYGGGAAGFRNDGAGGLVLDPAIALDTGPLPFASAVALADLDGDGDLDAYLGRDRDEADLILHNDGAGRFTATPLPGPVGAASTGTFADFDGDGDLDLFVARTVTDSDAAGVLDGEITRGDGCRLYLQDADGAFVDATDRLPADDIWGWTFQGQAVDADRDGDLDLYLANDWGAWMVPNRLLLNDGDARFTRHPDCNCELTMFGMGAGLGDVNGDAIADLYITDIGGPNLLVGMGDGTFYDGTDVFGAAIPAAEDSLTSWGTSFVDLDQDGWTDIAVTFGQLGQPEFADELSDEDWVDGPEQPDRTLMADRQGGFRLVDLGWNDPSRGRAVAVGDMDRDGRPDLVSSGKYYLRQSRTLGGCAPGLTVVLHGPPGNVHGIGARVDVDHGARVASAWMLPSTTGSSSAPELYLGLGGQPVAAAVTVTWPDGRTETRTEVPAGTVEFTW